MDYNVFLEENRSVFSNNLESSINVELSNKTRLLPNDNLTNNFSLYDQYNQERDGCEQFRVILAINPVCSNVLFNMKTEIAINEGSDDCEVLLDGYTNFSKDTYAPDAQNTTSPISYRQAIVDTEYSHKKIGNFIYHCGADIFNNHMLRANSFVHVNKIETTAKAKCGPVYNTIKDYLRDDRGAIVSQQINVNYNQTSDDTKTEMHLYEYDTIRSMITAFSEECDEKNGWWGFTNPGNIDIPNSEDENLLVNRMMASNKACEFIDLYPDRSLFSFIPNFNRYRKRIEKNWDYCITYPYKSDYDMIDTICSGKNQAIRAVARKLIDTSSTQILECSSYFKHNLSVGDYVTVYYYYPHYEVKNGADPAVATNPDKLTYDKGVIYDEALNPIKTVASVEFQRFSKKVKVISVGDAQGDHTDRIFSIKLSDVSSIYEYLKFFGLFYKKNVNNTECQYYFRKFKKLKTSNGDDLKSDINKVAFAKNIYGDDIAQVIFTDDIDVAGLKDNNNRPVSEVFFTTIKRNKGYKEWYSANTFNTDKIEYSHCFGKLTSGIDFSGIEGEPFDYNAHYLHNLNQDDLGFNNTAVSNAVSIEIGRTFSAWGETVLSGCPKTLENDITIDFDEFYGDVVEYDVANAQETVIGNVYHRFNTAQRESWNKYYKSQYQDMITSDDYDEANGAKSPFAVKTYYLNDIGTSRRDCDKEATKAQLMYGNICPEGYMYIPHYSIKLKADDDDVTTSDAKFINYSNPKLTLKATYVVEKSDGSINLYYSRTEALMNMDSSKDTLSEMNPYYQLTIDVPVNYGFYKGDYMAFYNSATTEVTWGEITAVSGLNLTIQFDYDSFQTIDNISVDYFTQSSGKKILYAFWSTDNVPTYAKLSMGEKKFTWRKIVPPSEMPTDNELYNLPFTNGRFYVEKNLNFFLKRQDPNGKYGLSTPVFRQFSQTVSNPMQKFIVGGYDPVDLSEIVTVVNNGITTCY